LHKSGRETTRCIATLADIPDIGGGPLRAARRFRRFCVDGSASIAGLAQAISGTEH